MSIYLSIYLFIYLHIYHISTYLSTYLIYQSINQSIYQFIYLSTYLSIYLFNLSINLYVYLYIYLIYQSIYQSIYLSIYGSASLVGFGRVFQFLYLNTVGRIPWVGISPSQGRYIYTEQHKHRINAGRHPCLKWDSKSTILAFEWTKRVHALYRAATVIGNIFVYGETILLECERCNWQHKHQILYLA
jgi:hypothetical protein